jgi:hypothetical protein
MFHLKQHNKLSVNVKGIFSAPIQHEVRIQDGNWSPYFGHYQNQRWGQWDSDSCWCLSAVNCVEDQMEWLWKNGMFSPEAKNFFTVNGYIDADGDISLSERFHEILCGNRDAGGTSQEAWQSFQTRGFIPRDILTYSLQQSQQWPTQQAFNNDYFNPAMVTPAMLALGQQCLKYINIAYQKIGADWYAKNKMILQAALQQAPICIGVSVPNPSYNWNNPIIKWDGGKTPSHEIELYALDSNGQYLIFDQYMPNLKILSADYFICFATQGIITAVAPASVNPIPQPTGEMNNSFWTAVMNWFNGIFNPKVPVGSFRWFWKSYQD